MEWGGVHFRSRRSTEEAKACPSQDIGYPSQHNIL